MNQNDHTVQAKHSPIHNGSQRRRKQMIYNVGFWILALFLIIGTIMMGFISWRVYQVSLITDDYISNHDIIVSITEEFGEVVEEFQSFESRVIDAEFSVFEPSISLFIESTEQAQSQLQSSENTILREQYELSQGLLTEMNTAGKTMISYGNIMSCAQNIYSELLKNSEAVANIDLTIDQAQDRIPNIEGLRAISTYLGNQALVSNNYLACYENTTTEIDIAMNTSTQERIEIYGKQLNAQSQNILELISRIESGDLESAESLSNRIATEQSLLYDLSPEAVIFVPSKQIEENIEQINIHIEEYNTFNEARGIIES